MHMRHWFCAGTASISLAIAVVVVDANAAIGGHVPHPEGSHAKLSAAPLGEVSEVACQSCTAEEAGSTWLLQRTAVKTARTSPNALPPRETRRPPHVSREDARRTVSTTTSTTTTSTSSLAVVEVRHRANDPLEWPDSRDEVVVVVQEPEPEEPYPGPMVRWFNAGIWAKGRAAAKKNVTLPITVSHEQAVDRVHILAKGAVLPATGIFMLDLILGTTLGASRFARFLPESLLTVLVAVLLGMVIRHLINWGWISLTDFALVDAAILNLFLLPIIIFNGAWSMNLPHFVSQLLYILIFAVLGTGITMLIIGWSSWYLAQLGLHDMTSLRANFAFAALISATDPVATLATFAQFKIAERQPLLNMLVLGESLVNDAVAIAAFKVINGFEKEGSLMLRMMGQLLGSMAFGVLLSACLVFAMRVAKQVGRHHDLGEVLFIFVSPYFVFSLAETLELSGIIATLFAGIVMRQYGSQHLTKEGEQSATDLLQAIARLADNGVFILCGTSTALITSAEGITYGVIAVVLCFAARAVAVLLCSDLTNRIKEHNDDHPHMVTRKDMFMIWLSGLRGGIALVLALELDSKWIGREDKSLIVNSTFVVICLMLLLCGSTTEPCLVALGLVPPPGGEPIFLETAWAQYDLSDSMKADRLPRRIGRWLHEMLDFVLVGGNSGAAQDLLLSQPAAEKGHLLAEKS